MWSTTWTHVRNIAYTTNTHVKNSDPPQTLLRSRQKLSLSLLSAFSECISVVISASHVFVERGVLALRGIASGLGRIGRRRRKKVKKMIKDMDWWNKMVFPVRRVWVSVSTRVKARKNGGGLLKLHDDIQTCGYEDVQVMWEMLRRSDSDVPSNQTTKRKQRPFWRVFVLTNSNRSDSSSFAPSHA